MHDAGTLIVDVIYAFSFFPFFPLPLQRLSIFQRRESLGQRVKELPLCCWALRPLFFLVPPIPRAKATIFTQALSGGLRIR